VVEPQMERAASRNQDVIGTGGLPIGEVHGDEDPGVAVARVQETRGLVAAHHGRRPPAGSRDVALRGGPPWTAHRGRVGAHGTSTLQGVFRSARRNRYGGGLTRLARTAASGRGAL